MSEAETAQDRFQRAYPPAAAPPGEAILLPFLPNGELLVRGTGGEGIAMLRGGAAEAVGAADGEPLYLGTLDGVPCVAYRARDEAADAEAGFRTVNLRSLWGRVDEEEYLLAGYASHLLYFQSVSGFCGRCGHSTEPGESHTWARRCTNCGHTVYPPVSPAVLLLVHDGGDRILLAHKAGWGKRYSILAGFVEPGESLEGCCRREALEEVGLPVTEVVYKGSQPWPFPQQVMVGFNALCETPDAPMRLDETELDDARWFRYDDLPELPGALSLSRQLIDAWLAERWAANGI